MRRGLDDRTFSVEATGQSLTYRWQKDGQPVADGANVSGPTTATLTLTGKFKADVGKYQVMVTGATPCSIVSSTEANLTVNDPP
ncbi:MAG: immunoglobulin domain-containing protein [Verrucomicrobiota bacterium]